MSISMQIGERGAAVAQGASVSPPRRWIGGIDIWRVLHTGRDVPATFARDD
jgi:hypothetical protein